MPDQIPACTDRSLVDFLIIGGGKSGSTSVYYYLTQHPRIFMPRVKEPRFFLLAGMGQEVTAAELAEFREAAREAVSKLDDYRALFADARRDQLRGEASIQYLGSEAAACNIGTQVPDARLLCILRDPAERAFSNVAQFRRDGAIGQPSVLDLLREHGKAHPSLHAGFYTHHLESYRRLAPHNPLRVWLYEDLVVQPMRTVREMADFIGAGGEFTPDITLRANVSGSASVTNPWALAYDWARRHRVHHHPWVSPLVPVQLRQWVVKNIGMRADRNRVRTRMTSEERAALIEFYRDDILRLQDFLSRDLGAWLDPNGPDTA